MSLVEWNEGYSVGIESIDLEHRALMADMNKLYEAFEAKAGKSALLDILDGLVIRTRVHFQNEESYFEKTGYPETASHVMEHRELIRQIHKVQEDYEKEAAGTLPLDVVLFLRDWLMEHIKASDKKYTKHLIANGIR